MPDKEKKSDFVVTDRRLFSTDGELRQDVVEDEERRAEHEREKRETQQRLNDERAAQNHPAPSAPAETVVPLEGPEPEAPSAAEQQASVNAYKESVRHIDDQINQEMRQQGQTRRAQDFEMTFEKFVASLYMSALMQLGLAAPPGREAGCGPDRRAPDHRHARHPAGEDQGQSQPGRSRTCCRTASMSCAWPISKSPI